MLCPLLQSPAVKAIVNPNDHSASRPVNAHTQTHMQTLSPRSSLQGSWQNRRRRGLVRRQRCRCAPPAHWFLRLEEPEGTAITQPPCPWHTTHTHTQIDRHTHTQMPTFIQTHTDPRCTYTSCSSCCLLLTYLPPLFSSSHPFPRAPFNSTPSISCYLSSFLTSSSPSSSPPPPNCRMHEPTYTHTPTHTLTCQVPSVRGRVEETWQRAEGIVCQEQRPRCAHLCCAGTQRAAAPHLC